MKIKIFAWLVCGVALVLGGCMTPPDPTEGKKVQIGSGEAVGRYERSFEAVWKAAKDTLIYNGVLTGEETVNKVLKAQVDNRSVWVKVEAVNPTLTAVTVVARKGMSGDSELAGQLREQMAVRLAGGAPLTPRPGSK